MRENQDDKWALSASLLIAVGLLSGILMTVLVQQWLSGHGSTNGKTAVAQIANKALSEPVQSPAKLGGTSASTSAGAIYGSPNVSSTVAIDPLQSSGACAASTVSPTITQQTSTVSQGTTAGATEMIPSGVYYSDSTSGYPISVGGRAVGSGVPQTTSTTVYVDQGGNVLPAPPMQAIGRNGLLSNPPVDPPSSHGTAYSRSL